MNLSVESAVPPRSVGNLLCFRPVGYSFFSMVIFCNKIVSVFHNTCLKPNPMPMQLASYLVRECSHDPHHDVLALLAGERLEARDEAHEVLEDVAHVVGQPPQRRLDVVAVNHHVRDAVLQVNE